MERFQNILLVMQGDDTEKTVASQAMELALYNQATLSVLIISPSFPENLNDYKDCYKESLLKCIEKMLKEARVDLDIPENKLSINIELESGDMLDIRVVRHVLKHHYDLVIKHAQQSENKGFDALEMELLHKCPCALFISRPFKHEYPKVKVAVAVDPMEEEPQAQQLSLNLLEISQSLAKQYSGQLNVIACWHFAFENYFRNSVFDKTSSNELNEMLQEAKNTSENALKSLLDQVKNNGTNYKINHLKGRPEVEIPSFIDEQHIDILVMGTLARTGISGFIIGNTAENVLQKIDCSLLALKPSGFVSPVKIN
ncbi:universal stress protein [Legionella impletisoli]|uniref:Universal stress protein n=1 Tax=Legionella impletisoli TaxID=343510 RepID=A0A917JYT3_9GAMM|nr:universal stress protein [Legionella impletisoli]GGI90380.1 universal stress protein [Legionella impletisoli]